MSGPLHPTRADVGITAAFGLAAAMEVALRDGWSGALLPDLLGSLSLQAFLLARQTQPLVAIGGYAGVAAVGTAVQAWLLPASNASSLVPIVALLALTYSLGAHGSRRDLLVGCPLPILVVVVIDLTDPTQGSLASAVPFFAVFVVALPVLAGRAVRSRRQLVARLREHEAALEAAHDRVLSEARMREEAELRDELDQALGTGLAALLERYPKVRAGAAGLGELETEARALLARTRESVVALSSPRPATEHMVDVPTAPAPVGEAVQAWAIVVAAAIGVGSLLELDSGARSFPVGLGLTVALVLAVALIWRHPIVATTVAWGAAASTSLTVRPFDDSLTGITVVVGTAFLVACLSEGRSALTGLGICVAGALAAMGTYDLLGRMVFLLLAWGAGRLLRDHILLAHRVEEAHERREAARDAEIRSTVLGQRALAARELHDALGHSLTVVALQAGAARRIQEQDPDGALAALTVMEEVTRTGMAELRTGLRARWDPTGLVATAREAGHPVTLTGVDPPTGISAVCQRVVQEAVTNVLRHAPGATLQIHLEGCRDRYRVRVQNGPPSVGRRAVTSGGHGLTGMRERVEAYGGTCTWATTSEGGFVVQADLPTVVTAEATR